MCTDNANTKTILGFSSMSIAFLFVVKCEESPELGKLVYFIEKHISLILLHYVYEDIMLYMHVL